MERIHRRYHPGNNDRPPRGVPRGWVEAFDDNLQHYVVGTSALCGRDVSTFNTNPKYGQVVWQGLSGCNACINSNLFTVEAIP